MVFRTQLLLNLLFVHSFSIYSIINVSVMHMYAIVFSTLLRSGLPLITDIFLHLKGLP